jgi:hypothetical protein
MRVKNPGSRPTAVDGLRTQARIEKDFAELAAEWRRDTRFLSSITEMASHPSYQKIIALGRPAIPLILREIEQRPDHWFWALNAITGEDPVDPEDDFDQAVEAWLRWGCSAGAQEAT